MKILKEYSGKYKIKNTHSVKKYLSDFLDEDREYLISIGLDNSMKVMYREIVSIGDGNSVTMSPRSIFRNAIARGAMNLIIVHNHPSNNPNFSDEDLKSRDALREAGKIIGISLMDFCIIFRDSDGKPEIKSAFVVSD